MVAVPVTADEAELVVIAGVDGIIPLEDSVFTGGTDGWVHPAARRSTAMSTQTSSMVRNGDDMIKLVGTMRK